jgi:hypothetical protein
MTLSRSPAPVRDPAGFGVRLSSAAFRFDFHQLARLSPIARSTNSAIEVRSEQLRPLPQNPNNSVVRPTLHDV